MTVGLDLCSGVVLSDTKLVCPSAMTCHAEKWHLKELFQLPQLITIVSFAILVVDSSLCGAGYSQSWAVNST